MEKLHSSSPTMTVDAHIDTPWIMTKYGVFDLQDKQSLSMVDFPRMKIGGLQAAIFALYLSDALQDAVGPQKASDLINQQIAALKFQPGCTIVDCTADAILVLQTRQVPIFLGLEGGRLIHGDLARLSELRRKGVRYLTITHNRNTDWADSATDIRYHGGLTRFGGEVVQEANSLGVLLDISHASDETAQAVMGNSTEPVIASHSGCRSLLNHPRNLSDNLIRALVRTGGVIHIPFARRFIGPKASGIADHIDHVVQLVGNANHVGIGSDLDGAEMVNGIHDVSCWRTAVSLEKRGYSVDDINAIMGGNTLWVLS